MVKSVKLTASDARHLVRILLGEELIKSLEDPPDFSFRHFRQGEDFSESSGDFALATGDEDAPSNECVLWFAFESSRVVDHLEEVFHRVCNHMWNLDRITIGADLLIGSQKALISFIVVDLVLGTGELAALDTIAE